MQKEAPKTKLDRRLVYILPSVLALCISLTTCVAVFSAYESYASSPRNGVRIVLSLGSAALAASTQSWMASLDFVTLLPVISALLTSFGFCFSGNVGVMRVVQGCDSALWLVHDTTKLVFGCIICDFLGLIIALAYVYLNRFDPDDGYWDPSFSDSADPIN